MQDMQNNISYDSKSLQASKILLCVLLFVSISYSKTNKAILSINNLDYLNYLEDENKENSEQLKKDWINPVSLSLSKNLGEVYDTNQLRISINQTIFKNGGIYKAIKYAKSLYKYNKLDIQNRRKNLIKDAYILLFNIHIVDLNIRKNELLLKNNNINITIKKEQILSGLLDTSYLDNAILESNKTKNNLVELKYKKIELNNKFKNLSNVNYEKFTLPKLKLNNKKEFLKNNLNLLKSQTSIEKKKYIWGMAVTKYLPTLNVKFDYLKYFDIHKKHNIKDSSSTNYGLVLNIPLDYSSFNVIEAQKISYLKNKLNFKNKLLEEENFFNTKLAKLNMIKSKKKIAQDDYKLYESLLKVMIEEQNAGTKTNNEIDILLNSQKLKSIDLNIYKLEEQIELLILYSKLK